MNYKNVDKQKIYDLYQELQSDTAVAKAMDISVVYAARVMQQFGRKKLTGTRNPHARTNANKIIDYIIENGGTISKAQKQLKLKVCDQLIYEEAEKRGVTLGDYRYYLRTSGVFTVWKPSGFYRKNGTTYIPATCSECRATSDLSYSKLFCNKRPSCPVCGAS